MIERSWVRFSIRYLIETVRKKDNATKLFFHFNLLLSTLLQYFVAVEKVTVTAQNFNAVKELSTLWPCSDFWPQLLQSLTFCDKPLWLKSWWENANEVLSPRIWNMFCYTTVIISKQCFFCKIDTADKILVKSLKKSLNFVMSAYCAFLQHKK